MSDLPKLQSVWKNKKLRYALELPPPAVAERRSRRLASRPQGPKPPPRLLRASSPPSPPTPVLPSSRASWCLQPRPNSWTLVSPKDASSIIMSGRDRLPRRFVEDGRGYADARAVEERRGHHPGIRVVDSRRGHPEIRVVEERRGYPAVRVIEDRRAYPAIQERPLMRAVPRSHPAALEEEIGLHEAEFRRLMADRHALAEERLELHRELQGGKEEVRHLNMIIAEINGKKEAYITELVDKRRKLEAELRANEPLRDEVMHLRGEIEKLLAVRKELSAKAASIMQELNRDRSDKQQLPMLKGEIDGLQHELTHIRNACESEQKVNFELVEQRKAMEKSMVSMAQEIQQMRAELANFDGRPWGTGGAYGMKLGSPEVTFSTQYGDKYNIHAGVSDKGPSHPPESSWGTYDKNRFQYR